MNSAWYGLTIIAVAVVVHWLVMHDGQPEGDRKGLFAMKPVGDVAARPIRRRKKFSLKNMH